MAAILNGGELTLSGDVGDYWGGDHFTYADVVVALAQIDDAADLTVRLNSGGGVAHEGAAIHALLARRSGRTDVVVDGAVASAGSLICCAGQTVTMTDGSVMMIHDPAGYTQGTSAAHAKAIESLEALATTYARVYAAKSGQTPEACREIMKAESWFTPEQAVAAGFANEVGTDKAKPVAAFDYRIYAHAPGRLVALAKANGWSREASRPHAASAAPPRREEEKSMTDKERADALAAELAELKKNPPDTAKAISDAVKADRERRGAVMALDEAQGREKLAERLAGTTMSLDDIKATLADAPTASAEEGVTAFAQRRMNGEGLNGGKPSTAKLSTNTTLSAVMKKTLGQKETV